MGFCPFHDDKNNRSLSVYVDAKGRSRWRCFVCGIGSTEIDAVMHSNPKHNHDTANRWLTSHGYMQETEKDVKERERNDAYTEFYKFTNHLLRTDPRAAGLRAYIVSRGVRAELIKTAPIGYYPTIEEVEVWLSTHQVNEKLAEEFLAPKSARYAAEGSIAFFYRHAFDQFSRIKLRNVLKEKEFPGIEKTEDEAKKEKTIIYLGGTAAKDKAGYFSPTMKASEADHAIVVEGEFDALVVFSMCRDSKPDCIEPLYCFGSGSSMEKGIDILSNIGIDNIYTFPDNDGPGIDYAFSIAEAHPHSFIIIPEDYKAGDDPASWSCCHKFNQLEDTFRQRIPAFAWIGKKLAEDANNSSVEEQSHIREKVINYAKKLSATNREMFLKSYAPITGVSYDSLCEEVQANDQLKYRRVLSKEAFGLQMSVPSKGGTTWEPISNAILEIVRDVLLDDGDGTLVRKFEVRIILVDKEVNVIISAEDYSNEKALYPILLANVGSDMWIKPKCLIYVRDAAQVLPRMSRIKIEENIYTHTGWSGNKFLMPNGYVDSEGFHDDDGVRVELPGSSSMYTRYKLAHPPADMRYIEDIIRNDILQVFPYSITLPMIAHTFLPPLLRYMMMEKPYCLWVHGMTGSFKTAYTAVLNSFWGDFRSADFETWRSTANSLERTGYNLKDCPMVIDDYKPTDVSSKMIVQTIHNYADRHNRNRLNNQAEAKKGFPMRCLLTATGEDLPSIGESSVLSRMLILPIRKSGDSAKLTKGQMNARLLPGVMAKFIQYVINLNLKEEAVFDILAQKKSMFQGGHNRSAEVMAMNSFAWDIFAEFMNMQDLSAKYYEVIEENKEITAELTKSEQAGQMFLRTVRDLIESGTHYLEGTKGANSTMHDDNAKRLGWVSDEAVYLLGNIALAEANTLRFRTVGSPINYSASAIYDQLVMDNLLIPTSKGKTTHVVKIDGASIRVIKLVRGVLEDVETSSDDTKYEDSDIRPQEGSSLLN